jgi:hypothetical protein
MGELEKRFGELPDRKDRFSAKEIVTYSTASIIVTALLLFSGFPLAFLFFMGSVAFLVWRMIAPARRSNVRPIFEFYLFADEIISTPRRRWYGFEIDEVIIRGEDIIRRFDPTPPLVFFALGVLYKLKGDAERSESYLRLISNSGIEEASITDPSPDLRDYVTLRRHMERSPEESPKIARAIRRLERLRELGIEKIDPIGDITDDRGLNDVDDGIADGSILRTVFDDRMHSGDATRFRQPITDVLHSVYDQPADKDS